MSVKIEARNLTISFRTNNGAVRAVRNISFAINEGETLAIAGESGSGKSVTTKAIMGISAPNAVVENGEIIYDGRDLLKIDEEDFHTLRGHKLSMVFQDPLSALNPVMRIGKQLTEAMILNNRERRSDGKKSVKRLIQAIRKNLPKSKRGEFDATLMQYSAPIREQMKQKIRHDDAKIACREVLRFIEDIRNELLKHSEYARVMECAIRLCASMENAAYLLQTTGYSKDSGKEFMAYFKNKDDIYETVRNKQINDYLDKLEKDTNGILTSDTTVFSVQASQPELYAAMQSFVSMAMHQSANSAYNSKKSAIEVLKRERKHFAQNPLASKGDCMDAAKRMSQAVASSIDPLNLVKDNASYVFASSMKTNIERYFLGVSKNPGEHARFVRDTHKHDELVAAGKECPEVVPEFLVDLDTTKNNILHSVDELIAAYEAAQMDVQGEHYEERAREMIAYIDNCVYDSIYVLPKWVAKNRAISIMKEVGIPEPYKRFQQYPFEFSGGMRQRIVIAIALSANPDVLICDEPTTALDVTIQAQILELINRLKKERNLTVIFITHDLGVVANMADKIAIMYAGKIVEYGTAEDVFYDPRHPYTWALLSSMPDLETKEKLEAIPGTPPDMIFPPKGDAFADRNKYAMKIDFEEQPPEFKVNDTHWAATWLLHPSAPHVEPPSIVTERISRMKKKVADKGSLEKNGGDKA